LSSAAGLSLDAQPAALTDSVRRNGFVSGTRVIVPERREAKSEVRSQIAGVRTAQRKQVLLLQSDF
jgi:hypothetical protein